MRRRAPAGRRGGTAPGRGTKAAAAAGPESRRGAEGGRREPGNDRNGRAAGGKGHRGLLQQPRGQGPAPNRGPGAEQENSSGKNEVRVFPEDTLPTLCYHPCASRAEPSCGMLPIGTPVSTCSFLKHTE
ncbi:splicing factor, proline- and glutamine-rich-like isoform X2 [Poecile atricapillus]|uniref:splicing factor, proline- and glutamine-rich-like isoform X2 n=1 Tax=Poecile atricapillus TaxID=48891 RepID=UPI002739818D|nr:splicing factor, proline- and glutamine-rich-like isoform X2 [Poecile atricapillus]